MRVIPFQIIEQMILAALYYLYILHDIPSNSPIQSFRNDLWTHVIILIRGYLNDTWLGILILERVSYYITDSGSFNTELSTIMVSFL